MYSLTSTLSAVNTSLGNADSLFKQSQDFRKKSIEEYKEAGRGLKEIKDIFEEAGATKTNPIETDLGTFTSFKNFLKDQGFNERRAYNYIKLYQRWDIVESLNLLENQACYRLNRTLAVIKWAESKLAEDPNWLSKPEYKLTNPDRLVTEEVEEGKVTLDKAIEIPKVEAYWLDKSNTNSEEPSRKELKQQIRLLESEVEQLREENEKLKELASQPVS